MGATIAPIATITSCSCNPSTPSVKTFNIEDSAEYATYRSTAKITSTILANTTYKVNVALISKEYVTTNLVGFGIARAGEYGPGMPEFGAHFNSFKIITNSQESTNQYLDECHPSVPFAEFKEDMRLAYTIEFTLDKPIEATEADPYIIYVGEYYSNVGTFALESGEYKGVDLAQRPISTRVKMTTPASIASTNITKTQIRDGSTVLTPDDTTKPGLIDISIWSGKTDVTSTYNPTCANGSFEIIFSTPINEEVVIKFTIAQRVESESSGYIYGLTS